MKRKIAAAAFVFFFTAFVIFATLTRPVSDSEADATNFANSVTSIDHNVPQNLSQNISVPMLPLPTLAAVPNPAAALDVIGVYITTANLNLRSGPGTDFTSFGIVPSGSRVYVLAYVSDEWYRVRTQSHTLSVDDESMGSMVGYMSTEFLMPAPTAAGDLIIGVTWPSADDVGHILSNIRGGLDFFLLTIDDLENFGRLSQFNAIFINCGSHHGVDTQVLRRFVQEGGVVYASDLAAFAVQPAFPGMFSFAQNTSSQIVHNASIVHTSLATHMGRNNIDVVFDLNSWAIITELSPSATVYIRGNVAGHGDRPLAFSFDYGRGRVFFTSFHNHVQATSDMVNFIEYLVFRIQHFEAERVLVTIADDAGYDFDGAVFGILDPQEVSDPFFYTPSANDFMLFFDPEMGDFTITLSDPAGNTFSSDNVGILTDLDVAMEDLHLAFDGFPLELLTTSMVVESLAGNQGFRVLNPISGEWSFWVQSNNVEPDALFAIGLAERPTAALTRAMFAQVLANLDGVNLDAYRYVAPSFYDVSTSDWFFAPVEWVVRSGIAEGIGRNRFAPNSPLTRQQMVTMLYNFTRYLNVELPVIRTASIPDFSSISSWAREAVRAMYEGGIISMDEDGYFRPGVTTTTQEIVYAYENLWDLIGRYAPYIYDWIFVMPPLSGELTEVASGMDAGLTISQVVTGLTHDQRNSGEGLNMVTLYMENIMRRGTTQRIPGGNISATMLNNGVAVARQIHDDTAVILDSNDVTLMRNLRTNVNFESDDANEISAAFPDDVSHIAFDSLTIESEFASVTVPREFIPVNSSLRVTRIEAENGVIVGAGDFSEVGEVVNAEDVGDETVGDAEDDPQSAGRFRRVWDALLDFSSPLGILLNYWALLVFILLIFIWLIVAGMGERLRRWVVPTFTILALAGNVFMVIHRHYLTPPRDEYDYAEETGYEEYEESGHVVVGDRVFYADSVEVNMTPGMRVTLSMPTNGHDPEFLVVVNENDEIQHSRINPITGTIDARIRNSGIYTIRENEVSFADIDDKNQLMQDAILQLASRGIMQGVTETHFYPDDLISRTEVVATIIMAFDMLDFDAQTTFVDVDINAWYYLAVATAQQEHLIDGFVDNTFRGYMVIPKDQMVVLAANMLIERMGYNVPNNVEYFLARFADRSRLARWSEDGIALATASNVLIHREDSRFAPHSNMTRGDAAIVLYRVFSRVW